MMMDKRALIIAVDFDGTLCSDNYPEIGTANETLIRRFIEYRTLGCLVCNLNIHFDYSIILKKKGK